MQLCGGVTIAGPTGAVVVSRPQVQVALAVLALERHRPIARDELAHLLWGDELSPHWQGALRGVLAKLRAAFEASGAGREVLVTNGGVITLDIPTHARIDVDAARLDTQRAEVALRDGMASRAVDLAAGAAEALVGGFLPGVDLVWADERRREIEEMCRRASRLHARAQVEAGSPLEALTPLRQLLATDPYDEDAFILLLRALVGSGDHYEARKAHDAHVEALRRELGVGPSPRLVAVREQLLDGSDVSRRSDERSSETRRAVGGANDRQVGPFVGRDALLENLLATFHRDDRRAQVLVIEGEPGVGKTRLVAEISGRLRDDGVRVLWGACDPFPELPYEPVAAALRHALSDDEGVTAEIARSGDDLALLGLGTVRLGHRDKDAAPGITRSRLFGAVTAVVDRLADRPLVWVVDDLQWAGAESLAMLAHVLVQLGDRDVTLVATCRERHPALAAALADLAWKVPSAVVELDGLDRDAVARWLADAGVVRPDEVATVVHERTGGNPLFLAELVKTAASAEGHLDPAALPPGLTELVGQRVATLAPEAELVVSVAALAGSSVDLTVLSEATGLDDRALYEAVDATVRARLLVEVGDGVRFGHALVRDAVDAGLGPARRAWFHLRLAEALLPWAGRPGVPIELARHYAGSGEGHGDAARTWALAAAEDALDRSGWEMAEHLAGGVLSARVSAPADRVGALVVRGRARRGLGDLTGADDALGEAVELARLYALPRRLAEAVHAIVGGGGVGAPDPARYRHVALVEEALVGLSAGDDDLRIPLLGSLALALLLTDRDDERERAAEEALDRARRHGDPAVMARALLDQRYRVAQDRTAERFREGEEALALSERCHLPEVTAAALVYRHEDALVLGDRAAAREAMLRATRHLERFPDPYWSWALSTWKVLDLVLEGDLEAAEAASVESLQRATDEGDSSWAMACFGVHRVLLCTLQGRAGEVIPLLDRAALENPRVPCYRAVKAFAALQAGEATTAAAELGRFAADGFASVPHDSNRLLTLAMLAETTVGLGERSLAGPLSELLLPYRDLYVVLNCYGGGGSVWGPVSAQLAGLAALVGDHNTAANWLGEAEAMCGDVGDRLFAARLAQGAAVRR
nr:AAA family ATPase [Rhabdothermincola salaria]